MDASGHVHEDSSESDASKNDKIKNGKIPNNRKKNNSPYGTFAGKKGEKGSPRKIGKETVHIP